MNRQFISFLLRWALNSFSLWVAAWILRGHGVTYDDSQTLTLFLLAGFILSIINVLLKPILIILSLPAILLTLGLFALIVNGFMVYLAAALVPGLHIGFWAAVLAGMIVGLVNYVLTSLLEPKGMTPA
jgi:putative membrane protein